MANRKPRPAASGAVGSTERQNPRSRGLDQLSIPELVRTILREDAAVAPAVARQAPAIARAIETIAESLRAGGRLIYVGAGTSGRIAALDAAECPPTFGARKWQVRALIAGGSRALRDALEDAEDSSAQGAADLASLGVAKRDVVAGISSSGATPYVLGALRLARRRGASTIAITANRNSPIASLASILIAPRTGPELIAGSTRMKAGTAQKMVLNALSTGAFVALGRVYNNWMVDLALTNRKLRERGLRILQQAAGADRRRAAQALARSRNKMRLALIMLKTGADARQARAMLEKAGGNLRLALGEPAGPQTAARPGRTPPRRG